MVNTQWMLGFFHSARRPSEPPKSLDTAAEPLLLRPSRGLFGQAQLRRDGSLQFGESTTKAAKTNHVQVFVCTYIFISLGQAKKFGG